MGKCANETRFAHPIFFTLAVIVGLAPPPLITCGMMTASIISFFIYYKIVIYTAACLAPYGTGYPSTPPYLKL